MSKLHGHFYNWYDTCTLHALDPKYVSTVDSGNLAAHLLVLVQGCKDLTEQPYPFSTLLNGIADSHRLLESALAELADTQRMQMVTLNDLQKKTEKLGGLLACTPATQEECVRLWRLIKPCTDNMLDLARAYAAERGDHIESSEMLAWATLLHNDINSHQRDMENFGSSIHFNLPIEYHQQPEAQHWKVLTQRINALAKLAEQLFVEMDFRFSYDPNRHLFSLGCGGEKGDMMTAIMTCLPRKPA